MSFPAHNHVGPPFPPLSDFFLYTLPFTCPASSHRHGGGRRARCGVSKDVQTLEQTIEGYLKARWSTIGRFVECERGEEIGGYPRDG